MFQAGEECIFFSGPKVHPLNQVGYPDTGLQWGCNSSLLEFRAHLALGWGQWPANVSLHRSLFVGTLGV